VPVKIIPPGILCKVLGWSDRDGPLRSPKDAGVEEKGRRDSFSNKYTGKVGVLQIIERVKSTNFFTAHKKNYPKATCTKGLRSLEVLNATMQPFPQVLHVKNEFS